MKYLLILMLAACTNTATQIRVIGVSDQSTKHCIKDKHIVCEYTTK